MKCLYMRNENTYKESFHEKDNKKTRIFLASSSELLEERKEISLFIHKENDRLLKDDIYLKLILWEELLHSLRVERVQDYFNEEMTKCDIVIVIFHKKIGQFTKEEFYEAYNNLKLGKKPKYILIFFKIDANEETSKDISKLKEEIERYGQLYDTFNNIDELLFKLHKQLRLIIDEISKKTHKKSITDAVFEKAINIYLRRAKSIHENLPAAGFSKPLTGVSINLEEIYIPLRGTIEWIAKEEFNAREIPLFKAFQKVFKRNKKGLFIQGEPGSGKTTHLKRMLLWCLQNSQDTMFLPPNMLPVFIPLRELKNTDESIDAFIQSQFNK